MKLYAVFHRDYESDYLQVIYSNSNFAKNWIDKQISELIEREKTYFIEGSEEGCVEDWEDWKERALVYEGFYIEEFELDNPNFDSKIIYDSTRSEQDV